MKDKLVVIGIVALIAMVGILLARDSSVVGGVADGQAYSFSTTTSTGTFTNQTTLKVGAGTLGCVHIVGAAAGQILLLNATTTDINLRAASQSTSTIRLLDIPISAAANTFCPEAEFSRGLTVSIIGTQPTTTITWK